MFYSYNGALMCQQKQQMHCCTAGSFGPLTRHPMSIVAISVFPRRRALDRAAIRRWRGRRRTCYIQATDMLLSTSASWLIVVCCVCGLCLRSLFLSVKKIAFKNKLVTNSYIVMKTNLNVPQPCFVTKSENFG